MTVTVGCPSPTPTAVPSSPVTTILPHPFTFLDDLDVARAKAAAERKLLFVDVWAPWCHTCLRMKHYVFPDPSLRPLAQTVVFAAIDSDQPSSATFLVRFPVSAWPTFFVIDPSNERILAYWPGSASASELRALIDDHLLANSYLARGRGDDAVRLLLERERQMPESYEPPARLADVLLSLERYDQALAAVDRALSHAYGPRRLRYLATKAVILEKLGRRAEQLSTLREELAGWDSPRRSQASESRRANARRRLDDALGDGTPLQHAPL